MAEVSVQLGLYGGTTELTDFHVVAAHTRILRDGTTAFVSEHLRWNRGQQGPRLRPAAPPEAPVDHPSLFEGVPSEPLPAFEAEPPSTPPLEGALCGQLSLWGVEQLPS